MNNSKIIAYFNEYLMEWFGLKTSDCNTYGLNNQAIYEINEFKKNFRIGSDDIILFTRDTSFWNVSNQGLVMTNKGIYRIEDNGHPEKRDFIPWVNIIDVTFKYPDFLFFLKDDKHCSIGYYSFFKNIDESALKRTIGKMLAQYLTQLAQQDENWTGEKHETNESQVTINRVCPNCGENIESIVVTEGNNEVIKTIFPKSFDGKKDFILPQNFGFMIWDNLYQKKLIDNISQLSMDSIEDLCQIAFSSGSFIISRCEKCNHLWDLIDEAKAIHSTNNNQILQKYLTFCETIEQTINTITDEVPLNAKDPEERGYMELLWQFYLANAKFFYYNCLDEKIEQKQDGHYYHQRCLKSLQNAEKFHTNNKYLLSYEYELKADMCDDNRQKFNLLNAAITSDMGLKRKAYIQKDINELYANIMRQWSLSTKIDQRRIIFIVNNLEDISGFYDATNSINYFFTIDKIPSGIVFPCGAPASNQLFIANPANPVEYVPYENHEYILFMDKIRELKRLLRYLGATEITFTSMRGASIEEIEKSAFDVNAEGHYEIHKASGGVSVGNRQEQKKSANQKIDFIEKLDPDEYPVLPDGLYWYESDPEWKDIVEARLRLNQLHFEQSISTNQVSSLDKQSQLDVNAAYENLMFSINANFHREREFHVKTAEETMWRITAEFKPLREFENSNKTVTGALKNLSSDEREYFEAMEECFENSNISERDRRMLERIRKSLGISEERAIELEAALTPQLTDDEKEYLEAVRECKEEGRIIERDRRMLERLRRSLGLSEERAGELESIV